MPKVSVCIVTWNSAKYINNCLKSINSQTFKDFELIIIDNNSSDNTLKIVNEITPYANVIALKNNTGFCGGHNIGIKISKGDYYMPFNPDIIAEPNYLLKMVEGFDVVNDKIGMISGKLLRLDPYSNKKTNIIDSTGIYFKKNRRSLDRGAEEDDLGQYNMPQYVFGASGAAPLYNRDMLEDIKINNEYFMEYFFAYREDVDLAWRAQHKGWKCIYYPEAVAYHVRNNTPKKRKDMSEVVNMHSVKNRLLLLIQNETMYGFIVDGWFFCMYDLMIFMYTILKERTSLKGFLFIIKNIKNILRIRRHIMSTSKINKHKFIKWFGRRDSYNIKKD